jgi:uncharacterized membrane protein
MTDDRDAPGDAAERARAQRRADRAKRRAERSSQRAEQPAPEAAHGEQPAPQAPHRSSPRTAQPAPQATRAERPAPQATHGEPPARRAPRSELLASSSGRLLAAIAGALALLTVVGLVALWPGHLPGGRQEAFGGPTVGAHVTTTSTVRCPGPTAQRCRRLTARIEDGRDKDRRVTLDLGPVELTPSLQTGDRIRVQPTGSGYGYADVDRHVPMIWLAIALAVLAVLVARWRGLLALVGVAISVVLVVTFLVPAILAGSDPVLTSLVAALAVMFVTLLLTYGPGAQSLAAALGIGLSLLLAAIVGHAAVAAAHLDGRTGELPISGLGVSLQGIVLAGMVIGVLGVLTDMAVSQASAVTALREANPALGPRALYRGAFAVGRDHLAATIHTLVLAYVGAALPLILVLRDSHVGFGDAVNGQIVAEPIIATLVGAIALVAAVPLTTALAAILVARVPAAALDAHHGHAH